MHSTRRIAVRIAFAAMAIAAFAPTALTQQSEVAKIRALSNQWQQDIAAQNVDRIVALHTPDAMIMFSHAPLVQGTTAIRGVYNDMVKIPGMVLHWTPTKIDVAGPIATEYGTYSESYDTPQGKESDAGNYVVIWHKINGQWRVAVDAPNTTTPLPTPPMDSSRMEMRSGSALTWNDLTGSGIPPGAKIAVLHGNPGGPGGFVLRLQFPDGYQIPAHWHPTPENVTVISGNLHLGMGNTFNAGALQSYSPGDYVYLPPRQSHFALARGVTVVQVHGRGPFQINVGAPK